MSNLIGYQLADKDNLCSDAGLDFVDDFDECRNQIGFFKTFYPDIGNSVTPLPDPNYPKGCLIFKHRDHIEVYFNTHKNGSRQSSSRQLCIRSGKLSKSVFGTTLSVIIFS